MLLKDLRERRGKPLRPAKLLLTGEAPADGATKSLTDANRPDLALLEVLPLSRSFSSSSLQHRRRALRLSLVRLLDRLGAERLGQRHSRRLGQPEHRNRRRRANPA